MIRDILYALGLYKDRWDTAWPNAKEGDEPTSGIKRAGDIGACQVCGERTSWRNTVTETWVCSLKCRMKAIRALKREPFRRMQEMFERFDAEKKEK